MQNAGNLFANNQLARLNPAQGLQGWRGGAPGGMDWAASQNLFRMPGQQQPQISQQLGGLPQMSQQMGLPQQLSQQQQMLMHQQYLQQQRVSSSSHPRPNLLADTPLRTWIRLATLL